MKVCLKECFEIWISAFRPSSATLSKNRNIKTGQLKKNNFLFVSGVTKKCTLPLHTLIFVCSTFLYTFYTLYTLLHIYTFFSNLHARARPWSRQGPIYTLTHTIYTHLHFYTLYTPMDQKFFRIRFSSSDWWKKIIKKFFVLICIIIKFFNR